MELDPEAFTLPVVEAPTGWILPVELVLRPTVDVEPVLSAELFATPEGDANDPLVPLGAVLPVPLLTPPVEPAVPPPRELDPLGE